MVVHGVFFVVVLLYLVVAGGRHRRLRRASLWPADPGGESSQGSEARVYAVREPALLLTVTRLTHDSASSMLVASMVS